MAGVTVTPGGGGAGFSAFEEQPMQIISATISTPKACSCLVAACGEIVDIIEKMPPNRTSFLCILHTPRGANTGFPEGENCEHLGYLCSGTFLVNKELTTR